jgi:Leu/Phe-tRNA-protein transferase
MFCLHHLTPDRKACNGGTFSLHHVSSQSSHPIISDDVYPSDFSLFDCQTQTKHLSNAAAADQARQQTSTGGDSMGKSRLIAAVRA